MITLKIPEPSPSLNDLLGRCHWSSYQKARKYWSWLILEAKVNAKIATPTRYEKVTVTVHRYGKSRPLDEDNLYGGCKVILDGLKDVGLILDDSPSHVTLQVCQTVGEPPPRTIITLAPTLDLSAGCAQARTI